MAYRFLFVPYDSVEANGMTYRAPRYLGGARGLIPTAPELVGVSWSGMDYGFINVGLVAADLTNEQFAWLDAQPGVIGIPKNLDASISDDEVIFMQSRLEAINLPADWLSISLTRREVLRRICGIIVYAQRVMAIRAIATGGVSRNPFAEGANLNMTISQISLAWRNTLAQAANELGYDYSWATPQTTLRELFRRMADFWGERPFYFGGTQL